MQGLVQRTAEFREIAVKFLVLKHGELDAARFCQASRCTAFDASSRGGHLHAGFR
jgi:hypothetical protein